MLNCWIGHLVLAAKPKSMPITTCTMKNRAALGQETTHLLATTLNCRMDGRKEKLQSMDMITVMISLAIKQCDVSSSKVNFKRLQFIAV